MWWNFIINLGISTMIIVTKAEQESYACNFEQDFCNWLPEINTSAFNWTRIRAHKDHTTGLGYYIVIDGTMSINKIHAELSTDFESSNRSKCISFWYNMNSVLGVQGSTLELYQRNEMGIPIQLRKYINSTEEIWIRETVDLPGTGPYRIIFRGTVVGQFDYIGLDDINTFEGNCSELPSINDYSTVPYNTAETFELPSINEYSTVPYNKEETMGGIHVTIVSALSVTIVAALVIIFIVCYRKKRADNSKPCQTQENTTGMTDSSNYNVINYSEMSDISIIKINENRNEIHTTQHHLQSNNTSIKQTQNICTKKESLSTNQSSLEHIYESDSIRNNQCELLSKKRELDKHIYESTEFVQPPDIKTSMEQHQIICHKYESLSTNRNLDKHIYESESIHTNQFESLTKPRESDKHTYESTEFVQPHDIEQNQDICHRYESLSTNRNSDKHIYESESIHTNQYESLTKPRESDTHAYESAELAQPPDI